MRYSQLLIPTVKEVPAEAEIPSHRLMIRAGFIRKLAAGTYSYLPLGWRSLLKISAIVREEMNAAGAQEISMPILQPTDLWRRSGRDVVFKDILFNFTDNHGRDNVLAPTAEEVVTSLVATDVKSYKQLPVNLYQINTKFRDEFRPQYGAIRSREFLMKDAYSFDATAEGLNVSYRRMYDAYCRIFDRCGLEYVIVEAESGGMGGTDTEEFMVPLGVGDVIVTTEDGSYAANIEKAEVDAVDRDQGLGTRDRASVSSLRDVPPVEGAKPQAVPAMEEVHTPDVGTIEAVCDFLGTKPEQMIKTLIYWNPDSQIVSKMQKYVSEHKDGAPDLLDRAVKHATSESAMGGVYIVLVRGDHEVNEAKLNGLLGESIGLLEYPDLVENITGAKQGFAGPMNLLGEPFVTSLIIDHSVAAMVAGVTGANKTDYHVRNVVPGRDFPLEGPNVIVADIRNAVEGDTHDGKPLKFSRGVEVGHVFKLGEKYSKILDASFLDENGARKPFVMGCYGIGINRILATAIEADTGHDANGCILPIGIAPFEVEIVPINNDNESVRSTAERIYDELRSAGADVLLDDRDARAGVKFKDADLIGIPLRIVVGERGLKDGKVEIKRRTDDKPTLVSAADAVAQARKILDQMKHN